MYIFKEGVIIPGRKGLDDKIVLIDASMFDTVNQLNETMSKIELEEGQIPVVFGNPLDVPKEGTVIRLPCDRSIETVNTLFTERLYDFLGVNMEYGYVQIIEDLRVKKNAWEKIQKDILEFVPTVFQMNEEEFEQHLKEREIIEITAILTQNARSAVQHALDERDNMIRRLRDCEVAVEHLYKDVEQLDAKIGNLRGSDGSEDKQEVLVEVLRNQKVDKITTVNSKLRIITKDIVCTPLDGDVGYDLGPLWLDIDFNSANVYVLGPEENKREGFWGMQSHPHANTLGHVCWGSAGNTVKELIRSFEIPLLVDYVISFCETVNLGDMAGRKISKWDEIGQVDKVNYNEEGTTRCDVCGNIFDNDDISEVSGIVCCNSCKEEM